MRYRLDPAMIARAEALIASGKSDNFVRRACGIGWMTIRKLRLGEYKTKPHHLDRWRCDHCGGVNLQPHCFVCQRDDGRPFKPRVLPKSLEFEYAPVVVPAPDDHRAGEMLA